MKFNKYKESFEGCSIPRNKELMRVFKDLNMVEQMGSGITRILKSYSKTAYKFMSNFVRITLPFAEGYIEHHASTTEDKILEFCQEPKSRSEIQKYLGFKNDEYFRKSILNPLLEAKKLARTILDKPTSPRQKFYYYR